MNKFGAIKTKLLSKLTESYAKENKAEIKDILTTIKENKEFKEMYLFYEEIENKYIDDKETAKLYVEGLNTYFGQGELFLRIVLALCNLSYPIQIIILYYLLKLGI